MQINCASLHITKETFMSIIPLNVSQGHAASIHVVLVHFVLILKTFF